MTPRARLYMTEEAARFGTTISELQSRSRQHEAIFARRAVWHRLRMDGLSLHQIADATGHNHASVYHGLHRPFPEPASTVQWPTPSITAEVDEEARAAVLASLEAMRAKHQRDLAQRY